MSARFVTSTAEVLELEAGNYRIGRSENCDLVIPTPQVSAVHAQLRIVADTAHVEDMGSTNGTFVNGVRLASSRELRPGDTIALGGCVQLRFEGTGSSGPPGHMSGPGIPGADECGVTEALGATNALAASGGQQSLGSGPPGPETSSAVPNGRSIRTPRGGSMTENAGSRSGQSGGISIDLVATLQLFARKVPYRFKVIGDDLNVRCQSAGSTDEWTFPRDVARDIVKVTAQSITYTPPGRKPVALAVARNPDEQRERDRLYAWLTGRPISSPISRQKVCDAACRNACGAGMAQLFAIAVYASVILVTHTKYSQTLQAPGFGTTRLLFHSPDHAGWFSLVGQSALDDQSSLGRMLEVLQQRLLIGLAISCALSVAGVLGTWVRALWGPILLGIVSAALLVETLAVALGLKLAAAPMSWRFTLSFGVGVWWFLGLRSVALLRLTESYIAAAKQLVRSRKCRPV